MAINPRIKQKAEDIRKKIFGTEVRESLASGIEAISEDVEATKERQITVEETMQTVIDETTGKDVISAPEIIAAHVDSNGTAHPNLKSRLDNFEVSATQQLQQTEYEVSRKRKLEDLDSEVLSAIEGGEGTSFNLLSIPQNRSVTPIKSSQTSAPTYKDLATFATPSADSQLFIPDEVLHKGLLNFEGNFNKAGNITFYLLEKTGDLTFKVLQKSEQSVSEGINVIYTNWMVEGNGFEYFGFSNQGAVRFKTTGGSGYYEKTIENHLVGQTMTVLDRPATDLYDLAIYPTYQYIELVERLNYLKYDKISNEDGDKLILSEPSQTKTKDLSSFTSISVKRLYVPNVELGNGNIVVHFKGMAGEVAQFYVLKKSGLTFEVVKEKTINLVQGENVIDMEYISRKDSGYYLGHSARTYYRATGGTGMYEANPGNFIIGDIITTTDSTVGGGSTFDFGVYVEYTGEAVRLGDKLADLDTQIAQVNDGKVKLTDFIMPRYKKIDDEVGFIGRWFDKEINGKTCKATINAGSEFYFKVENTLNVNINFEPNHAKETPYFAYSVDGNAMTRQLITSPLVTLPDKNEHIFRVVVDGLTETEDKWLGEKGVALHNITVDSGGVVTGLLPKNRVGMFYGDSITEGIRVLSMEANANGNSASGAYPFSTCKNLNAIPHYVGFGASGVTNVGSGNKFGVVIDNMTSNIKTPYSEPDFIVINHGTNDSGATDLDYENGLASALNRLTIKYSGVPIFVMIPFRQTKAESIRKVTKNRSNCCVVETIGWGVTYTDGTHPDYNGGQIAGAKLADEITKVLGKSYFINI